MQFPSSEPRVLNGIDNGGKLYFLEGGGVQKSFSRNIPVGGCMYVLSE